MLSAVEIVHWTLIAINDQNEWKKIIVNDIKVENSPFSFGRPFFVSLRNNCTCRLTLRVRFPQVVVFRRCVLTQIQITKPILDNPKCHNISKLI